MWRNLPQKFFDLVQSSIFYGQLKSRMGGSRPRKWGSGWIPDLTTNRERILSASQSGLKLIPFSKSLVLLHPPTTHLAGIFFNHIQSLSLKQVNSEIHVSNLTSNQELTHDP